MIVFIQETNITRCVFQKAPEKLYAYKNYIMHADFKVFKYKIIIYYKGELQGKTIVYFNTLEI